MVNIEKIRQDFPILKRRIYGKEMAYLDNAATTQKPRQVIEAIKNYYEQSNANVHRSIHKLSEEATELYERAHKKAGELIGADFEEIVLTKNTTESINIAANSLKSCLGKGDKIVLTEMEHHSNIVPWQQAAKEKNARVEYISITENGELDEKDAAMKLKGAKIFSFSHVSNVLGTINDAEKLCRLARESGALVMVDAAQSVPHMPVDVSRIKPDLMAFSSHKMLGPSGTGVLYGKKEMLEEMTPFVTGGDMIREVTFKGATWNELPWKFEAGTPNIEGAVGLGAAIDYLNRIGMEAIERNGKRLAKYAIEKLLEIKGIKIYGPQKRAGIISFNIEKIHAHDLASILDREGICIRAGHHCAMPLMSVLNAAGTARASLYIYNTKEEIDRLASATEKARKVFHGN